MLEWIDDITAFIFLHDAPQKADILFIPGNGHAEPSEYAAQLYHSGYAPLILPRTLLRYDRRILWAEIRRKALRRAF